MTDDELVDCAPMTDAELIEWLEGLIKPHARQLTAQEQDRLIALARLGAAVKKAPDPLDEALNSGDGVYRP